MIDILLIQPPALKPAEPPLALAVLLAHLRAQEIAARAIDANLDAYLYLLDGQRLAEKVGSTRDTSLVRALKHGNDSLELLRSSAGDSNFARYNTAVRYLNRLLAVWNGASGEERLTLGDYQNSELSPFNPADLEQVAGGTVPTLFANYFNHQLLPQIQDLSPKIIAISVNYLHQALPAFALAGLLSRAFPAILLVAGGGLITSWQEPILRHNLHLPVFDHLVFGPGEKNLAQLVQRRSTTAYSLADNRDICFAPDFSFARLRDYLSPAPLLPLAASRGCYWRKCLFCPEAAAPVHPYCSFSASELPATMRRLADQHQISHIQLTDNAIPVNMLRALADNPEQLRGISWFGFVRFEAALEDGDFIRRLARSGCRMLQLGLESGSQQVLDRLGKGITLSSVAKILGNLAAAGIATFVYIMLGTPGETEADAEQTLKFLEAHADQIGFLNLSIMNMPRSSGLLDNPEQYGIADTDRVADETPLTLYQRFNSSSDWNRATARRFLDKRLLGSAKIRAIVNRTPPLFTSNHAVFFADEVVKKRRTGS